MIDLVILLQFEIGRESRKKKNHIVGCFPYMLVRTSAAPRCRQWKNQRRKLLLLLLLLLPWCCLTNTRFTPPLTSGRVHIPAGGHLGRRHAERQPLSQTDTITNRERGPAKASCGEKVTRTTLAEPAGAKDRKKTKRKEPGWVMLLFFCSVLLRIRPWFRRPRLAAVSVRKSYSHPGAVQRCAALP